MVQQARCAGAGSVVIILRAMKLSEKCLAWTWLKENAQEEWKAFFTAYEILKKDPYAGFELGRKIDPGLKATGYVSITYTAMAILRGLNPNDSALGFRGNTKTDLAHKLDPVINDWVLREKTTNPNQRLDPIVWGDVLPDGFAL